MTSDLEHAIKYKSTRRIVSAYPMAHAFMFTQVHETLVNTVYHYFTPGKSEIIAPKLE